MADWKFLKMHLLAKHSTTHTHTLPFLLHFSLLEITSYFIFNLLYCRFTTHILCRAATDAIIIRIAINRSIDNTENEIVNCERWKKAE